MEKLLYGIFPNENFVDLSLYQFGYEECDPLHSFGPAKRNHFLFHYIFSGKGRLRSVNDKGVENEYRLEGGQGFLFWPSQQNLYIADEKAPWIYAWVEFDGLKARELVTQAGLTFNYPIYVSRDHDEREKMKNELLAIVKNKNAMPLSLIGHLYMFMSALLASSSMRKKVSGGSLREFTRGSLSRLLSSTIRKILALKTLPPFAALIVLTWERFFAACFIQVRKIFLFNIVLTKPVN